MRQSHEHYTKCFPNLLRYRCTTKRETSGASLKILKCLTWKSAEVLQWGITEGKARRILNLTDGSENEPGQWNQMNIEVLDDEIKAWVNGDLVNHGYDCTAKKGKIAIQAEGSEVEFRKIDFTPINVLTE